MSILLLMVVLLFGLTCPSNSFDYKLNDKERNYLDKCRRLVLETYTCEFHYGLVYNVTGNMFDQVWKEYGQEKKNEKLPQKYCCNAFEIADCWAGLIRIDRTCFSNDERQQAEQLFAELDGRLMVGNRVNRICEEDYHSYCKREISCSTFTKILHWLLIIVAILLLIILVFSAITIIVVHFFPSCEKKRKNKHKNSKTGSGQIVAVSSNVKSMDLKSLIKQTVSCSKDPNSKSKSKRNNLSRIHSEQDTLRSKSSH